MTEENRPLVDRLKITEFVSTCFEQRFGDRMFQHAIKALGLKPTETVNLEAPKKGRVGLYDPMVAWLIASMNSSHRARLEDMDNELERFRLLWDEVTSRTEAKSIPGFTEEREFGAQLLMLTSPLVAMELREIRRLVGQHEEVLELSVNGRQFMVNVLQAYNDAYGKTLLDLQIDPRLAKRQSVSEQVKEFALVWLKEAEFQFEADRHNASE